ncbi:family 20 glycosylhydrolase [Helcococcus bovis]|uniref:family 20 glycosylhydrolase n=1 Tax=Helcococcus bovis TaxID=3153252 RepID=UPI0038B9CEF2
MRINTKKLNEKLLTFTYPQEIKFINSETFYIKNIIYSGEIRNVYNIFYENIKEFFINDGKVFILELNFNENLNFSEQGYKLIVKENKILVEYKNEIGIIYALMKLNNIIKINKSLFEFEIIDYPRLSERRILLDIGRKYFTKDWILNLIFEMSKLKLNTLMLHFSENRGFRIESEFDPSIVSKDGFLTKKDIREIIDYAKNKNISIIPSLDTPGHVEHILKIHPELGQIDINGKNSKYSFDITRKSVLEYIKNLYLEFMELFNNSKYFHIGFDEYMDFKSEQFKNKYQKILEENSKINGFSSWTDSINLYLNEISKLMIENNFIPRIWNDCLHYGENTSNIFSNKLENRIGVDYWCNIPWDDNVVNISYLLDRGYNEIYNSNSSFFYYVLREEMPKDGRKQNSWDYFNQYQRIYNIWSPGVFFGENIDNEDNRIKGASISIWCDNQNLVSQDIIFEDIKKELRAFAAKTWNYKINENIDIEKYFENLRIVE